MAFALLASLVTSLCSACCRRFRSGAWTLSGRSPRTAAAVPIDRARRGRTDAAGDHGRSGRRGLRAAGGRFAARAQLREHAERGPRLDPAGVLAARLSLPAAPFPAERRHLLLVNILERLRGTPGLVNAAFTSEMPLNAGGSTVGFTMRGPDGPVTVQASPRVVSPELIPALALHRQSPRVHAIRHRHVAARRDRQPAFARHYLGGSALGAEVPMGIGYMDAAAPATIVGVLDDVRYLSAADATQPRSTIRSCSCDGV